MMTIAKVTSSDAATSYYEAADDYYAEDGHAPCSWWGAGAQALELSRSVDPTDFRALLDGVLPDGTLMHHGGEGARRAGTDLTFSAPKSVSMQALIAGDRRLIQAHEAAVNRTLAYIESRHAACRITEAGKTTREHTGNLVVAKYQHNLSREADPQLHTHAVVLNLTQRGDEQWRAVDAAPFYKYKMLLGAHYRAELAKEVQALGYQIRLTDPDGRFELSHLSREHVQAFSSRSEAIEEALRKRGKTRDTATALEREIATLASRKGKTDVDYSALREQWQQKSSELGINFTPSNAHAGIAEGDRHDRISEAVQFAIDHLTERQSIVAHEQLVACALGRATGVASINDIEATLATFVAHGTLLMEDGKYTTCAAQALELDILAIEAQGRDSLRSIVQPALFPHFFDANLNAGQRAAAGLILHSPHQAVGIQGLAGTGKTRMLSEVYEQAINSGWQCIGLTTSAAAALKLSESGIESGTIAAFRSRDCGGVDAQTLVVVDEAGMVSAVDMHAIMKAVQEAGARLALIGDTNQLKAVQAGAPFAQLQDAGMHTAQMRDIQRQTNPILKAAVQHAAEGNVAQSLKLLDNQVVEVAHAYQRYSLIASTYAALSPAERSRTLILAATKSAREAINNEVRAHLNLTGEAISVLVSRDMTQAQMRSSTSYQPGNIVQVQKNYGSMGLARKVLLARQDDGEIVTWRPALSHHVAVYDVSQRNLAEGDRIRVTANDFGEGLINGDLGTVAKITAESVTLTKDTGESVTLDRRQPLRIDHGYCTTVHSAQGQDRARVMINADVSAAMSNQSWYYTAISRAKAEVSVYTDDRALLAETMSRTDNRARALDLRPQRVKGTELGTNL